MRRAKLLFLLLAAATLCTCTVWGQSTIPADVLKVDYFSNANTSGAPDETMRLDDPGTASSGNVCAYIAVFDSNQEMSECCGCLLTPDGLRTFSINNDLTSNPLTGVKLQTGVIKVIGGKPHNNTCPLPGQANSTPTLEPGIRGWVTHVQNSNFSVTETASQDATLSSAEISRLGNECYAITLDGSGSGICSCGTGD